MRFFEKKKRLRHAAQTKKTDFRHNLYKNMHKPNDIAQNTINMLSLAFGVIENPYWMQHSKWASLDPSRSFHL